MAALCVVKVCVGGGCARAKLCRASRMHSRSVEALPYCKVRVVITYVVVHLLPESTVAYVSSGLAHRL